MKKTILAVASGGGHWMQLERLASTFDEHNVIWISTLDGLSCRLERGIYRRVTDANVNSKMRLGKLAIEMAIEVLRTRPHVVISTGAAPGYFGMVYGRLLGAETIWIDSIANADEMSYCGKKVRVWAKHWYTQWPKVASKTGAAYAGKLV